MPSKLPPHRRGLESLSAGRRRHVVIDQSSTPPNQTRILARTLAIQPRKVKAVDGTVEWVAPESKERFVKEGAACLIWNQQELS